MKEIAIDGGRLSDYIFDKNIKQKELSNLTGIQESAISDIINNKRAVSTRYLESICRALNISADYLLGLSDVAERDAKINDIGINDEGYNALRALYGDHDITREIMNTFLSVFIANDGELAKKFKEYIVELTERTSLKDRDIDGADDYFEKIALYQLQMLFSNDIVPTYKEIACKHFRSFTVLYGGEFLGYCIGEENQEEDWIYYQHEELYEYDLKKYRESEVIEIAEKRRKEFYETHHLCQDNGEGDNGEEKN